MKYLLIIIFFIHPYVNPIFTQIAGFENWSKKDKEKFNDARSAHKAKKTDQALKVYCKLLDKYEGESELELWTGLAYKELGKYDLAIGHLLRAEENSIDKDPLLSSTIAEVYRIEKDYTKAAIYYEKYLTLADSSQDTYQKVKKLRDQMIFIKDQMANPVAFDPKPISENINTLTSEYLPQFTADNSIVYFTRRIRFQEDIFYSEKSEEGYSKAKPLKEVNTAEYNEGAHCISADGNTFIFTHEDDKYGVGDHDLYIMKKVDGKWQKPKIMNKRINTVLWESQPSLSPDGNILFFASNRDGGYGGKDIWYSVIGKDGYWSSPKNVGNIINTEKDESSPFLHPDLRTLYFRSDGHLGMGSYDLFVSRREDGVGWTDVQNLGYPINSEGQEGALTVSLDGKKAYFATDYDGEKVNDHLDIYQFDLPKDLRPQPCTYLLITTLDKETNQPIQSNLEIVNILTNRRMIDKLSSTDGSLLTALPIKNKMMINIEAEGYIFYSDQIIIDSVTHNLDPYEKTVYLEKVPVAENKRRSFVLKNILFESGTAELQEISITEISRLSDILKENDHLKLEVIGHTDDVGSNADNLRLSTRRAEAVKTALISQGVTHHRISAQGKGESEPIADNTTEEGRLLNRRTEFILY